MISPLFMADSGTETKGGEMESQNIPEAKPVEQPQTPAPAAGQAASGRAVTTLILGILSVICSGFVAGIPAIVLGSMELKAIKAGRAPAAGESAAKVGLVLGIVGTAFTCLALLGIVLMIVLGISLNSIEAVQNVSLVI